MKEVNIDLCKYLDEIYNVRYNINNHFYEKAVSKLFELMSLYPNNAEAFYEMGELCYKVWNNAEATKYYLKALEIDSNYVPVYTTLAFIFIKDERFDEAENLLNRALSVKSNDKSNIYYYFGLLFQNKEDYDTALINYKKALQYAVNQEQIDMYSKFIYSCKELRGYE